MPETPGLPSSSPGHPMHQVNSVGALRSANDMAAVWRCQLSEAGKEEAAKVRRFRLREKFHLSL